MTPTPGKTSLTVKDKVRDQRVPGSVGTVVKVGPEVSEVRWSIPQYLPSFTTNKYLRPLANLLVARDFDPL